MLGGWDEQKFSYAVGLINTLYGNPNLYNFGTMLSHSFHLNPNTFCKMPRNCFFHYLIINPMLARIGIDYPRALYNYYCVLFLCNEYLLPLGKEDKKLAQNLGSVTYLTKVLSCNFI